MYRLVVAAIITSLAACGTTDDRPLTLPNITETILRPTCGSAPCHSTFTQELGDVFDTVKGARQSIINNALVVIPDDEAMPDMSRLLVAIEVGLPSVLEPGSGKIRMPYDAPMPNEDIVLIRKWIAAGAPGAQCIPEDGNVCISTNVTACNADGNLGNVVMMCTGSCIAGACQ